MMSSATGTPRAGLIGYTGFVGGNLQRQSAFQHLYNSRNIDEIRGREFELLVCSGAPAEKWKANRDPEQDRASLKRLTDALADVRATKVVLISTVDVYPTPVGVDEDSPIDESAAQPYGRHRRELERFVADRFDSVAVRLPGLFGEGLKKNIIYDFLHDNRVDQVHADAVFQFYDLANVWRDVSVALDAGLAVVNFATEPVSVADVARHGFGRLFDSRPAGAPPARYDMRSRHAPLFGGRAGYLYDREQVLTSLATFVGARRGKS